MQAKVMLPERAHENSPQSLLGIPHVQVLDVKPCAARYCL